MTTWKNSSAIERFTYDETQRTLEIVFAVHRDGFALSTELLPAMKVEIIRCARCRAQSQDGKAIRGRGGHAHWC